MPYTQVVFMSEASENQPPNQEVKRIDWRGLVHGAKRMKTNPQLTVGGCGKQWKTVNLDIHIYG